jgi:hypothetical protein
MPVLKDKPIRDLRECQGCEECEHTEGLHIFNGRKWQCKRCFFAKEGSRWPLSMAAQIDKFKGKKRTSGDVHRTANAARE